MILALMIILGIFGYISIAGFVGRIYFQSVSKKCLSKNGRHSYCEHEVGGFFAGAFWPVTIAGSVGFLGAQSVGAAAKEEKAANRRKEEIAEAKHKAEIARLARMEHEELDRQLRSLEKPK